MQTPRSFKVRTIQDMIDKLEWEIQQLYESEVSGNEVTASYFAINASLTAWHVVDWIFNCASEAQRNEWCSLSSSSEKRPMTRVAVFFKERERALALCQEIANSSKHLYLSCSDIGVKAEAPVHVTVHSRAGSMLAGDALAHHSAIVMIRDGDVNTPARHIFSAASEFLWHFAKDNCLLELPG